MKTIAATCMVLLGLLLPVLAFSQTDDIQELKTQLRSRSGVDRIETFLDLSDAYLQSSDYDEARKYTQEALDLAERMQRVDYQAIALNREGKVLTISGKRGLFGKDLASARFRESINLLQKKPNRALLIDNLEHLRILAKRNGRADELAEVEKEIARARDLVDKLPPPEQSPLTLEEVQDNIITRLIETQNKQESVSSQRLNYEKERQRLQAELEAQREEIDRMSMNQLKAAFLLNERAKKLDSLQFQNRIDSLNVVAAKLALQESESTRNFYLAGLIAVILLAGGVTFSFLRARQNARLLSEKNKIIRKEKERSENLLLNILPSLVAEELKKQGSTSARYFEDVSVLFADFVGFSRIAEKLTPQELVNELDTCFKAFDEIVTKYNLEKIKTIGDAYMVAGGIPHGGGSQIRDMVRAALEMQNWLAKWNIERRKQKLPIFDARIGIHRGPVVAGVVGSRKFAFDIWGDTVNIASRIESAGEGGKINISGEVFKIIENDFSCEYRGKIPAKNKGEIDMYFVQN
ncbi:MAG: hypothetical protein EP344_02305 [Bacteroidetes bacterium]|nr:MAG: hypothetical protein EP344_02305 [Bacteroidota bacterium]